VTARAFIVDAVCQALAAACRSSDVDRLRRQQQLRHRHPDQHRHQQGWQSDHGRKATARFSLKRVFLGESIMIEFSSSAHGSDLALVTHLPPQGSGDDTGR
jgi:hypothetical protein